MEKCLETEIIMGMDICSAPGCGAFIKDDTKPCLDCAGRGNASPFGDKAPWTNSQWASHRDAEEDLNRGKY